MRRLAVLSLVLSSCVVKLDAAPDLERVTLVGIEAGARVTPGTTIEVRIEGVELWKRTIPVEVHRITDGGTDQIAEELTAIFDEQPERQTATIRWTVKGDFLARKGKSEIYFLARYDGDSVRSDSFVVEVDPRLTGIELVGLDPNERVDVGSTIRVKVRGSEVWLLPVRIELHQNGQLVKTATISFDSALDEQSATYDWAIAGPFVDRAGRHDLYARAVLGEQALISPTVFVEVFTEVTSVNVLVEGTAAGWDQIIRFPATLAIAVEGTGLADLPVFVDLFRASPEVVITTKSETARTNRVEVPFVPGADLFGPGEDSVSIYFRARAGESQGSSPTVRLDIWGIARCAWYRAGQELPNEAEVVGGTEVELRAITWGFEGRSATFDIYENDDIGDDYLTTLASTVEGDRVILPWIAIFTEDNIFDRQAEYYFDLRIENRTCRSPRLHVEKP